MHESYQPYYIQEIKHERTTQNDVPIAEQEVNSLPATTYYVQEANASSLVFQSAAACAQPLCVHVHNHYVCMCTTTMCACAQPLCVHVQHTKSHALSLISPCMHTHTFFFILQGCT